MLYYKPNLDEALASLAKLLPHLPAPRLAEFMNCNGVNLAEITNGNDNLPVSDQPELLVGSLGPFPRNLPKHWLAAWNHHQNRLVRNSQWIRCYDEFAEAQIHDNDLFVPVDMEDLDGVVAGILLLACRPLPSPAREKLISRTKSHWWGAYWAAHGVIFGHEASALLVGIANDPRLAAWLWLTNPDLAAPLVPQAMERNDLWSSIIALRQPLSDLWLGRVCIQAPWQSLPAMTALVLQPTAPALLKCQWINRLQIGHPRLAYLAVRWARFTWSSNWQNLRAQLRETSCSDKGLTWFHFHRDVDIEPEHAKAALSQTDVDVLWQAELVAFLKDDGLALRHRMMAGHLDEVEARLTLQWLQRRARHRP